VTDARLRSFVSRSPVAVLAAVLFATLAWADATGYAGMPTGWWLMPLALAVAVGGVDEIVRLFAADDFLLPGWILRPGVAAIVLAAFFVSPTMPDSPIASLGGPAVALMAVMIALFVHEIGTYRTGGRALERLACGMLSVAYVGLSMAFLVALRLLPVGAGDGAATSSIVPLATAVAIVKVGDVVAYLVGSLIGRRKLAPVLSPGKTWEGAAAGLAASVLASWGMLEWLAIDLVARPLGGWVVYGLAVGLAGMAGDLAESLLKRELHAKDSGRSLAGLGGVLDLADSLFFAAPIAWILWVVRLPVPG
jgi:phosphatidate cytidylyltransferase